LFLELVPDDTIQGSIYDAKGRLVGNLDLLGGVNHWRPVDLLPGVYYIYVPTVSVNEILTEICSDNADCQNQYLPQYQAIKPQIEKILIIK
jgi:hypothetical protein